MVEPMVRRSEFTDGHFGLALFSDLHLGATDIQEQKLRDDLKRSCDENRRILINGDVVEAILPHDRKRYTPSRAMSLRDDVLNEQTYYAVDFLAPYVDYIDLIGDGNHEAALLKYNSYDIIGAICVLLNQKRPQSIGMIHRAGYQGYARYLIEYRKGHGNAFTIFHHHGVGGSAPVSKGMIDFNRIVYSHDADLYWVGHKHVGTHDPYVMRDRLTVGNKYELRRCHAVYTAGYKNGANFDKKGKGHNSHYSDQFYSMQACGYAVVDIYQNLNDKSIKSVEVISR
ncbi:MAG: hypothetical protein RBT66_07470 [bacterium]|jgi:hypothetical protein|nr:hypothetical protein [bacterium]